MSSKNTRSRIKLDHPCMKRELMSSLTDSTVKFARNGLFMNIEDS